MDLKLNNMQEYKCNGINMSHEQAKDFLMKIIMSNSAMPDCEYNGVIKPLGDYFVTEFRYPNSEELNILTEFCLDQDEFASFSVNFCNIDTVNAFPYYILTYNKQRLTFLNISALIEHIVLQLTEVGDYEGQNLN